MKEKWNTENKMALAFF